MAVARRGSVLIIDPKGEHLPRGCRPDPVSPDTMPMSVAGFHSMVREIVRDAIASPDPAHRPPILDPFRVIRCD
jgi:hypothetical protein